MTAGGGGKVSRMLDGPWSGGLDGVVGAMGAALAMYGFLIVATRLSGLRSLAQLSAFDLLMTISIGSMLATTALSPSVPLVDGVAAAGVLFGAQTAISLLRRRLGTRLIDNQPSVLMIGEELLDDHLREARMTTDDVMSKLRQEGIRDLGEVGVVVLERTGSVSVIPRDADGQIRVAKPLVAGVRGHDRVPSLRRG